MLKPLLVAIQFMTRLPVPLSCLPEHYDDKLMGQSVLAYPVVGLIIGLILWGLASLMSGLPSLVVAALLLFVWILITGALHLDGLADCADAWVGGHGDQDKTLGIMKDSFIGPVGVAAVVSLLLLKFASLSAQPSMMLALLLPPVVSRAFIVLLFLTTPYVREKGLGEKQAKFIPILPANALLIGLAVVVVASIGMTGLWLLLITASGFFLLRWVSIASIGGMTGDTAGAMIEILETVILLVILLLFL